VWAAASLLPDPGRHPARLLQTPPRRHHHHHHHHQPHPCPQVKQGNKPSLSHPPLTTAVLKQISFLPPFQHNSHINTPRREYNHHRSRLLPDTDLPHQPDRRLRLPGLLGGQLQRQRHADLPRRGVLRPRVRGVELRLDAQRDVVLRHFLRGPAQRDGVQVRVPEARDGVWPSSEDIYLVRSASRGEGKRDMFVMGVGV